MNNFTVLVVHIRGTRTRSHVQPRIVEATVTGSGLTVCILLPVGARQIPRDVSRARV